MLSLHIYTRSKFLSGFKESDGTEEILHQLELLEHEDIGIDKNQLKMSACQALSKLAAKSGEFLERTLCDLSMSREMIHIN